MGALEFDAGAGINFGMGAANGTTGNLFYLFTTPVEEYSNCTSGLPLLTLATSAALDCDKSFACNTMHWFPLPSNNKLQNVRCLVFETW